ncbi:MAG TPA: GWxTD domain-containing protein [Thermoanaerobaculia bacterium]|nr:GWxTD domain-containing protein [Thermoanaerobaculia bacterium]
MRQPLLLALAGSLAVLACAGEGAAPRTPADLTNPYLGPAWSQWLVGAIASMATQAEVDRYLAVRSDQEAEAFVAAFWQRRDPDPTRPGNRLHELFESRAQEADRRFAEAGYPGRRTPRGQIWVLFGQPEEIEYETNPRVGEPPLEVWSYPREAARGLHGKTPAHQYHFIKRGELTVRYHPLREGPQRRPTLLDG